MEHKKDYSLLRPFDLEAAKAGALLTCCPGHAANHMFGGDPVWKYVAGPDVDGRILVEVIESGRFAALSRPESFCMAPLAWVEGRPVYKGDVLYSKFFTTCRDPLPDGGKFTVTGFRDGGDGGGCLAAGEVSRDYFTLPSSCSWTSPESTKAPKFKRGDLVRKISGSEWHGYVVGEYSTELTPEGYAVESAAHRGSVQTYPAAALELMPIF